LINPLKAYRILVVDADIELAQVLKAMLREMGFSNVHLTKSGVDAISLMRTMVFDFIITEWATQQLDGIAMLEFIRRNPNSPNPTIPIIMLTGRAEQVDVALARDYGINEYVIKPFTAKSIYSRLERIVEQPRSFVVAKTFVGPDRRSR
jgi:two-component system chemotaxis response regulator CheY